MIQALIVAALLTITLALPVPALAEHMGSSGAGTTLSLDLRAGADWFTLGGGLSGDSGYYGASIAGQARPGGLMLDGRVEGPARSFDFRFDADVFEALSHLWPRRRDRL